MYSLTNSIVYSLTNSIVYSLIIGDDEMLCQSTLVVVLLLLLGCRGDEANTTESCTSIAVSASCSRAAQDGGGCTTLDAYLKEMSQSLLTKCVSVILSGGTHTLSRPEILSSKSYLNVSLALRGRDRDGTVVICTFKSSTTLHLLHFINLSSVTIDGVTMEGCDRPLRFENIRSLSVWNSVFS